MSEDPREMVENTLEEAIRRITLKVENIPPYVGFTKDACVNPGELPGKIAEYLKRTR